MQISSERDCTQTYRLDLEYDGTDFAGWQIQPGRRTVQSCLEEAVVGLFGRKASVIGSGRTDAGVHAKGQVAHFRVPPLRPPEVVLAALNSRLPEDIRVRKAAYQPKTFHARYSARWRGYGYRIALKPLAVGRQYCWHCTSRLDVEAMQNSTRFLLGSHNFRTFAHFSEKERHYLSTVYRAEWSGTEDLLEFRIEANRFLHGMIRFLVGAMIEVGRGKAAVDSLRDLISARNVEAAPPKVPPQGLTLLKVGYLPWPGDDIKTGIVSAT